MNKNDFLKLKYSLRENPFIDGRASVRWLETWVNREKELKDWRRILQRAEQGQTNQIAFVIGEYGRGKTLALLKIYEEAKVRDSLLPIYLNFHGEQKPKSPGLDFVFRMLRSIPLKEISSHSKGKIKSALDRIPNNFNEVRNVLERLLVGDDKQKSLAQFFITGQIKPNNTQLKELGVIRKIDDIEIAKEYLIGMLALCKGLGYSSLIFAVDEFEYLFSLIPKSQRTIYLALLRGLYDMPEGGEEKLQDIARLTFFIAISEDGWRLLNEMEQQERDQGGPIRPFFRRVALRSLLQPFDKAETEELVRKRLSVDRPQGKYTGKPLIPFTKDFVDFVFKRTSGESWKIIQICSHVLDAGLEKGVSKLDSKFGELVVRERNLVTL